MWKTRVSGAMLILLSAAALPEHLAAQERAPDQEKPVVFCWKGQPLPHCDHVLLVEMQGRFLVSSTSRTRTQPSRPDLELRAFDHGLEWNLGVLRNVSGDWALGGTVSVGTGSTNPLTGLRGRARRWLSSTASVELEVGARASAMGRHWGSGTLWGPTAGARLNAGDHGSLFVRWDGIDAPGGLSRAGSQVEEGFQQGLYAGFSLGHTWAVAGSAALGGLVLWIVSTMGDF